MPAPPYTVWFLRQRDRSGLFSVRFEVHDSVGAVQVRPSRSTSPTGSTGTLRRVSAAEIKHSYLLYRETNGTRWGEVALWPEGHDPMTLPQAEWVRLPQAAREPPAAPQTEDDGLDEHSFPGVVLDEDGMPILSGPNRNSYPNGLIRMLRQKNRRLAEELRATQEKLAALKASIKQK